MSALRLAFRQVRYLNRSFWRNPASAFFTFAFPLMFLVIFTGIFGESDTSTLPNGIEVANATYYTASILAFAVITACYTNVAMSVAFARDEGLLKRVRGTPMPGWAYLLGRVLHSTVLMVVLVALVCAFGKLAYDIDLPEATLPAFIVTLVVGAAAFCSLGLACTIIIPNADAAPAIVNATILPLLFLSGVFIPIDDAPAWLGAIADVFPVRHFLVASFDAFLPATPSASGWAVEELLIVAAWGLAGLAVSARWFMWEPRR
jgi:ABC-2 type transport system permease protein